MCICIYVKYLGTLYFLIKQDTVYMKIQLNNNVLLSVHERNFEFNRSRGVSLTSIL